MRNDPRRALAWVWIAVAVAVIGLVLGPRIWGSAGGTEAELLTTVKRTEPEGLRVSVGAAPPLVSSRHSFDRLTVAAVGTGAEVTGTLELHGRWGQTEVSSLGIERIPFVRR